MRFLVSILIAFCLAVGLAAVVVALLTLESRPLVESDPQIAVADFGAVREILKEHGPRTMPAGSTGTLTLTRSELTLLLNHLLNYYSSGAAAVQLARESLAVKASLRLPNGPWARFLNFGLVISLPAGEPQVKALWFGQLSVPGWLAGLMLRASLHFFGPRAAVDLIQNLAVADDSLRVTYRWEPELLEAVRRRLVPDMDSERLKIFHDRLVDLAANQGTRKRVSMKSFLTGLFDFAAARFGGNPVADNRAILVVLGAYVNHRTLEPLVPQARHWRRPKPLTLTLDGRKDLARHFLTSAALAVTGGRFLSDTMGIYKEMVDAKKGSGFSFSDLAADRAGTRFGELATESPEAAKKLWRVFVGTIQEADFMPSIENLPEFMSEAAFHARFGEVGSPAYNRLAQEIEHRIAALSLYRG